MNTESFNGIIFIIQLYICVYVYVYIFCEDEKKRGETEAIK